MSRKNSKGRYDLEISRTDDSYHTVLYLTNRQVSWLTISIMLIVSIVFIVGYFLGQKAIQAVCAAHNKHHFLVDQVISEQDMDSQGDETAEPMVNRIQQLYYAQLMGFGTSKAAERFAHRLQQKNIAVKVIERNSETTQGKKIIWYQVVTECFDNKDELLAFVRKIEENEHLNDIHIVAC